MRLPPAVRPDYLPVFPLLGVAQRPPPDSSRQMLAAAASLARRLMPGCTEGSRAVSFMPASGRLAGISSRFIE